jgi:hypothetical protein
VRRVFCRHLKLRTPIKPTEMDLLNRSASTPAARAPLKTLPAHLEGRPLAPHNQLHDEVTPLPAALLGRCTPSALPRHGCARRRTGDCAHRAAVCTPLCTCRAATPPRIAAACSHVSHRPKPVVCERYQLLPASPWSSRPASDATDTDADGPAQQPSSVRDDAAPHPHELHAGQGRPLRIAVAGGGR